MNRVDVLFSEFVLLYRRRRELTQDRLAHLSGVSRNYISLIESGKANVSLDAADRIATALGFQLSLLEITEGKNVHLADF